MTSAHSLLTIKHMTTKLSEKQLKVLVKESVREVIDAEVMKLRATFIPFVGQREQKEIERLYKKPSRRLGKSYIIDA